MKVFISYWQQADYSKSRTKMRCEQVWLRDTPSQCNINFKASIYNFHELVKKYILSHSCMPFWKWIFPSFLEIHDHCSLLKSTCFFLALRMYILAVAQWTYFYSKIFFTEKDNFFHKTSVSVHILAYYTYFQYCPWCTFSF